MTAVITIQNLLRELSKLALDSEYYKQPIDSDIDRKFREIFSNMVSLKHADLGQVVKKVTGDNARVLGLFAERMASLAVRQNSIGPVRDGLFALIIYSRSEDPRDVLLVLSLLHDAAIKTTGAAERVFSDVSSVVGGSDLLKDFLSRSEEDKSIDAMGYEESKDEEGFLYIRTW
jgi:hypothetical protein